MLILCECRFCLIIRFGPKGRPVTLNLSVLQYNVSRIFDMSRQITRPGAWDKKISCPGYFIFNSYEDQNSQNKKIHLSVIYAAWSIRVRVKLESVPADFRTRGIIKPGTVADLIHRQRSITKHTNVEWPGDLISMPLGCGRKLECRLCTKKAPLCHKVWTQNLCTVRWPCWPVHRHAALE